MANRSCAKAIEMLHRDPRLRIVPLAARALFILVGEALEQLSGRAFCFGNRPGTLAEVALLVSAPETEVETQLETLLEIGLLVRRASDGALMLPDALVTDHPTSSQRNGGLGGRPRRGETADEASARRAQGILKLPIQGGRSENQETQAKPSAETETHARAPTTTTSTTKPTKQPREVLGFGAELSTIAKCDLRRGRWDLRPVTEWLADGIGEALIRETIAAVACRESYSASDVHSFRYFDNPIREAHAMRVQPSDLRSKERADRLEHWINGGCYGPAPELAA